MIEQNKNGIIVIVLLSTFFGLVAGIVGSMTIKSYFGTSSSFWGELNFINNNLERPNLVINGAKKVVVAQDEKIDEVISQVSPSLVGIYKKKTINAEDDEINLNSFYKNSEQVGTALIITSDGWALSDALNKQDFLGKNKELNLEKYVVIDSNKNIFKIDDVVVDPETAYIFFHIEAKDLPVVNIANQNDLKIGETVLGLNFNHEAFLSSILSLRDIDDYFSLSSDFYFDKVSLVNSPSKDFYSSFVFDVSGRLILLFNKKGDLIPARVFNVAIDTLFTEKEILRPSLGIEYADLSYLVYDNEKEGNTSRKGAFVVRVNKQKGVGNTDNSLQINDIIKEIDGITLDENNNLSKIIMNHNVGDRINLKILRDSKEFNLELELQELK